MELYLDSANLEEVRTVAALGCVSGVTTNPSLVAQQGGRFQERVEEICRLVKGPVSAEVLSLGWEDMVQEGRRMRGWGSEVTIKLPMTREGVRACSVLESEGIPTNVTLVFSLNQGLLAARAGASFVSPFVGRLDDVGQDGLGLVAQIAQTFQNYGLETRIIAASIRHPSHVVGAALAGADIATIPYGVLMQLFDHPLTQAGLDRFQRDWAGLKEK